MPATSRAEEMARRRLNNQLCANCPEPGTTARKLRTAHVTLCAACDRALEKAARPRNLARKREEPES